MLLSSAAGDSVSHDKTANINTNEWKKFITPFKVILPSIFFFLPSSVTIFHYIFSFFDFFRFSFIFSWCLFIFCCWFIYSFFFDIFPILLSFLFLMFFPCIFYSSFLSFCLSFRPAVISQLQDLLFIWRNTKSADDVWSHLLSVNRQETRAALTSRTRLDRPSVFTGLSKYPWCRSHVLDPSELSAGSHTSQMWPLDNKNVEVVDVFLMQHFSIRSLYPVNKFIFQLSIFFKCLCLYRKWFSLSNIFTQRQMLCNILPFFSQFTWQPFSVS